MSTQSQYEVVVEVDGLDLGAFEMRSGGDVTSEPVKRRSGGMTGYKSYPARAQYDDVTAGRVRELARDHETLRFLRARVGSARASVTEHALSESGARFGTPTVWVGLLTGLVEGEYDNESDEPRMMELTVQVTSVSTGRRTR